MHTKYMTRLLDDLLPRAGAGANEEGVADDDSGLEVVEADTGGTPKRLNNR